MSGNVFEWCHDWYGVYTEVSQTNPTGPASGTTRISRGGGYLSSNAHFCRVSFRISISQSDNSISTFGFRLAHPMK